MSLPCSRGGRIAPLGLAVAMAALPLWGCAEVESESEAGYEPSKLGPAAVTFTAEGAARTGLRTEAVRRIGGRIVVPYAALLYGAEGDTFVYRSPKPLRYRRTEVRVGRIEGDRVLLSHGPPPGTRVVTVGAAEVYGTEQEVPSK